MNHILLIVLNLIEYIKKFFFGGKKLDISDNLLLKKESEKCYKIIYEWVTINKEYYKFIDKSFNYNGHKYFLGLNSATDNFTLKENCCIGGFTFADRINISSAIQNGKYLASIKLPFYNKDLIVVEYPPKELRANMIIIKKFYDLHNISTHIHLKITKNIYLGIAKNYDNLIIDKDDPNILITMIKLFDIKDCVFNKFLKYVIKKKYVYTINYIIENNYYNISHIETLKSIIFLRNNTLSTSLFLSIKKNICAEFIIHDIAIFHCTHDPNKLMDYISLCIKLDNYIIFNHLLDYFDCFEEVIDELGKNEWLETFLLSNITNYKNLIYYVNKFPEERETFLIKMINYHKTSLFRYTIDTLDGLDRTIFNLSPLIQSNLGKKILIKNIFDSWGIYVLSLELYICYLKNEDDICDVENVITLTKYTDFGIDICNFRLLKIFIKKNLTESFSYVIDTVRNDFANYEEMFLKLFKWCIDYKKINGINSLKEYVKINALPKSYIKKIIRLKIRKLFK